MKKNRLWTGLSSVVMFLLCLSIIGTNLAMEYAGQINGELGISTSRIVQLDGESTEDTVYFKSSYGELTGDNLKKLIADTTKQSVTESEEGIVLLKNEGNALPLSADEMNVTLFGHAVVQPLYRSNSAGSTAHEGEEGVDLFEALDENGFRINESLFDAYGKTETKRGVAGFNFQKQERTFWSFGEEAASFYTGDIQATWADDYNDTAIVMLAREGGEGAELYMEDPLEGISQLALHQDEKDLLAMIRDSGKFKKTIVLLNSGNPMEVEWLDEYGVDACLWIGCPGAKGFLGVADVLTGESNPSGKLTTTYAVNSLSAPAVANNSFNNHEWTNWDEMKNKLTDSPEEVSHYTVQVEGIYLGYKYYETRYEDAVLNRYNADGIAGSSTGKAWSYQNEVSYPFGYGLSYTTFDQTLDSVSEKGDRIALTITVTNTGDVPGKSVVQVYAQTPYGTYEKEKGIEKSAVQLLDFGKTGLLEPGQSETLTIDCDKYLLASYDYQGVEGFVMSEGDYYVSIGNDAHDALNNILAAKGAGNLVNPEGDGVEGDAGKAYQWKENFDETRYRTSPYTDVRVTNQFEDCDGNYWNEGAVTYLSRSDWQNTFPVEATTISLTDEMVEILNGDYYKKPADAPSLNDIVQGEDKGIQLISMRGVDYDDPLWEDFLSQMTIDEMASLIANRFGTQEVVSVSAPSAPAGDGPDGIGGMISSFREEVYGFNHPTACYTSETVLAASFNKELMARRGALMGEEALFLGLVENWGPGVNLHRTPFGGRNFEYFSEDANMNYLCAIPYVEEMQKKGVNAGPKHVTGNDQEINREGIVNFFNEQGFRETALRGVEGAVAKAEAHSIMQAFNRIGLIGSFSRTELNTHVIRDEWGYIGHIETDAVAGADKGYKSYYASMLASGTDSFCLDFPGMSTRVVTEAIKANDDGYLLGSLRRAAHDILYNIANSNIMNGYSANTKVESVTPWWQTMLFSLIGLFALLELLCLALLTRVKLQEKKTTITMEEE